MKKLNIGHINKKIFNVHADANPPIQLNKSLPSEADFHESHSIQLPPKDYSKETKDYLPNSDQNFKLRANAKAPSKRLAVLLDNKADPNFKIHHYTIDTIEKSSNMKSSQNESHELNKPRQFRHSGSITNFKGADFLKSHDFSRLMVSKVMTRGAQRALKEKTENKENMIMQDQAVRTASVSNEKSEENLIDDHKATKIAMNDMKKMGNHRNDNSKQKSKLRRIRMIYNSGNSLLGENTRLNLSQHQTNKMQPHKLHSMLNPSVSPLRKANSALKFDFAEIPNARLCTSPGHQKISNSVQINDYHSAQPKKIKEKEKHKKTSSTSLFDRRNNIPKTGISVLKQDIPRHQRKGSSGFVGISALVTRPSDTDRELFLHGSAELPRGIYQRLPTEKSMKERGSGSDMLLTEPVRNLEEHEHEGYSTDKKLEEKSKRKGESLAPSLPVNDNIDIESFSKLESAFSVFLKEHLIRLDKGQTTLRLEKIVKAWNIFTETLNVGNGDDLSENSKPKVTEDEISNKRVSTEPDMKILKGNSDLLRKASQKKSRSRVSIFPAQINMLPLKKAVEKQVDGSLPQNYQESIEEILVGYKNLQQIVQQQQSTINTLQRNEEKMLRLIYELKNQTNTEKSLEREDSRLNDNYEDFIHETSKKVNKHNNNQGNHDESQVYEESISALLREDLPMAGSIDSSSSIFHYNFEFVKRPSYAKSTADSTPFTLDTAVSHNKLNPLLKDKLKLDFRGLNPPCKENKLGNGIMMEKLNLGALKGDNQNGNQEVPGFHEEFMSKIGEFSLSWRQAAMNERNL